MSVICKYVCFINDMDIIWDVVYNFTLRVLTKHTVRTGNPQVPFLVFFLMFYHHFFIKSWPRYILTSGEKTIFVF